MADPLAVHQGLYDAVETGDIDLMRSLWLPGDSTVCVFPGAEPVSGTASIMRAWAVVMANTGYIQYILTGVQVQYHDRVALISCTENVLSESGDASDVFVGAKSVATAVLVDSPAGWRIWSHHSSLVGGDQHDEGG